MGKCSEMTTITTFADCIRTDSMFFRQKKLVRVQSFAENKIRRVVFISNDVFFCINNMLENWSYLFHKYTIISTSFVLLSFLLVYIHLEMYRNYGNCPTAFDELVNTC